MSTPLPPSSSLAARLHDYLLSHFVLNNPRILNLPQANYFATPIQSIPRNPGVGCTPLQCWFNVNDAVKAGRGRAVFGWALWDGPWEDVCIAQPHAVLADASGKLVCITPSEEGLCPLEAITFFADPRIPFDYEHRRAPPTFCLSKDLAITGANVGRWIDNELNLVGIADAWPDNFGMLAMGDGPAAQASK